jgi:hypothetical protein
MVAAVIRGSHVGQREKCFVYYESIKREPKIRGIYECRCDERLQTKTKEFTRLPYTGLRKEKERKKKRQTVRMHNRAGSKQRNRVKGEKCCT